MAGHMVNLTTKFEYAMPIHSSIINQSSFNHFICSNNNTNMHINTSESSRTARSHKNTDSCPEKEYSMTIIQFIITQNYRQENEKSYDISYRIPLTVRSQPLLMHMTYA